MLMMIPAPIMIESPPPQRFLAIWLLSKGDMLFVFLARFFGRRTLFEPKFALCYPVGLAGFLQRTLARVWFKGGGLLLMHGEGGSAARFFERLLPGNCPFFSPKFSPPYPPSFLRAFALY